MGVAKKGFLTIKLNVQRSMPGDPRRSDSPGKMLRSIAISALSTSIAYAAQAPGE